MSLPIGGLLDSPESSFSTGEASRKPNGVDMKIRLSELTNTRFIQNHRRDWITLSIEKPHECFISYQSIIKDSEWNPVYDLLVQCFNYKNQIYPKKSHNVALWTDCMLRQSRCHHYSSCYYHRTWKKKLCKIISISWGLVSLHIIGD